MGNDLASLGTDQTAGQGWGYIAEHHDGIEVFGLHELLERNHDPGRLHRMRSRAHPQVMIWLPNAEIVEEDIAHRCVVVLASVNQVNVRSLTLSSASRTGLTFMKLGRAAAIQAIFIRLLRPSLVSVENVRAASGGFRGNSLSASPVDCESGRSRGVSVACPFVCVGVPGRPDSFFHRDLRLVARHLVQRVDVGVGMGNVTGPVRTVLNLERRSRAAPRSPTGSRGG